MKINQILSLNSHRSWNIPSRNWSYYQEWNDAVFLHWKVNAEELKKFIPKDLEIDLIENSAWISLVAFDMENIRPRHLPAFPPISYFHEINIRTYVKFNNKTGVYFLSIEGGKELSCRIAKNMSGLPYRYSRMKRKTGFYTSENNSPKSNFELKFKVSKKLEHKTQTDLFLTERYALFQDAGNCLNEFEIHHIEWPIHEIEIENLKVDYPQFEDLIGKEPDLVHYSSGVQVIAWDKTSFPIIK